MVLIGRPLLSQWMALRRKGVHPGFMRGGFWFPVLAVAVTAVVVVTVVSSSRSPRSRAFLIPSKLPPEVLARVLGQPLSGMRPA